MEENMSLKLYFLYESLFHITKEMKVFCNFKNIISDFNLILPEFFDMPKEKNMKIELYFEKLKKCKNIQINEKNKLKKINDPKFKEK